jgi:hypothetical protein
VRLVVPLDASAIEGFESDRPVRVLAVDATGQPLTELQIAKFDAKGQAVATFSLAQRTGSARVVVGPGDATDEELAGLQTLRVDLLGRRWAGQPELRLPLLKIPPFHWYWWLSQPLGRGADGCDWLGLTTIPLLRAL